MRTLSITQVELPLAQPFIIARGTRTSIKVVQVQLEQDGHVAKGECTPIERYQQTPDSVVTQLESIRPKIEAGLERHQLRQLIPHGAAMNALDSALFRLDAARAGQDIWRLSDIQPPQSIACAQTISLGSVDAMATAAHKAASRGASLLKLKLNSEQVVDKVAAVRAAAPDCTLIIDANESWEPETLPGLLEELAAFDIHMVEQPLPAGKDAVLADFSHPVPLCADESCHTSADIAQLALRYEFINIKLDKCGGPTHALEMAEMGRQHGLRLMVGCMLGSSLAMESALPIAAQAELVDLDGPTWLKRDLPPALNFRDGRIWL